MTVSSFTSVIWTLAALAWPAGFFLKKLVILEPVYVQHNLYTLRLQGQPGRAFGYDNSGQCCVCVVHPQWLTVK